MITPGACRALVLAAGEGRRFGGEKLDAPVRGRPLLDHVLDAVREACAGGLLDGGVVVLRAGDAAVDRAKAAGLEPVENDDPAAGLSRSLKLGLDRLASFPGTATGAAMVFLGDQPEVRVATVRLLLDRRARGAACVRPRYAGAPADPGHPVLLDRSAWTAARETVGDAGAARVVRLADGFELVDVPGANPDVDTPADLERVGRA
ncbi:MAG TPA: nucleotidyltransferase family protein [Gemmatimonadota bacterium]